MAWPSPKRLAFYGCLLVWCGLQILFFLPPGWPNRSFMFVLPSQQGDFQFFQKGRSAVLIGAFSDRFQRLPRMELIPFMKKKGMNRIRRLVLTGHDSSQTGALEELQNHFKIDELNYPQDSALRMRKTFSKVKQDMRFNRLQTGFAAEGLIPKTKLGSDGQKEVILQMKGSSGS